MAKTANDSKTVMVIVRLIVIYDISDAVAENTIKVRFTVKYKCVSITDLCVPYQYFRGFFVFLIKKINLRLSGTCSLCGFLWTLNYICLKVLFLLCLSVQQKPL